MNASTLITFPPTATRGQLIDVRALIRHPMETGYRRNSDGVLQPRDLIRRFECHFEAENTRVLVFSAELFAAIAANPFFSFGLRATQSGALVFAWTGDRGFAHVERVALTVV